MALASSARDSASALRDNGPGAAVGSSVPFIVIILLAFIVAAVGGGSLILGAGAARGGLGEARREAHRAI